MRAVLRFSLYKGDWLSRFRERGPPSTSHPHKGSSLGIAPLCNSGIQCIT